MSLYLKTYYPLEFLVAVANNEGGFYRRELYFIQLLKEGQTCRHPASITAKATTAFR
jgi:DNA polymerase-3 subunit alpha